MSASTVARHDMAQVDVAHLELPVAAATKILQGTHVCVDISVGGVKQAADTASFVYFGIALNTADNTAGALGDIKVKVMPVSQIKFARFNYPSAAATVLGKLACFVDDNTVGLASATTNDIVAGRIVRIDGTGTAITVVVDVTDHAAQPVAA